MDLRVEYIPRFAFYGNEVLSWKLPRRVGLVEAFFSQGHCRVDAGHTFSVEMRHFEPFILKIPDENEIFYRAAGIVSINSYDANLRVIVRKPKFRRLGQWDKGLYLNGILELFGGLQSTAQFLEHSYWRTVFERLSLGRPEKEAGLFERVRNRLEKKRLLIASQLGGGHAKAIDWLSRLVIRYARELQLRQHEISFSELEVRLSRTARALHSGKSTVSDGNITGRSRGGPEVGYADCSGFSRTLTDRGVLQQGVRIRCTNCGSRFWREMGTLQQKVRCDGCNATVPVPVESVWRYRLNSLIRNGIALHGCVPVISALRDLRESARDSFIYTHGVALFKEYGDPQPEAEMDLLCISDGKLVCGEVKSSASEFTQEELGKLARIAADIKADEVAISAFS